MHRIAHLLRRSVDALRRGPFVTAVAVGTIFLAVLVTGLLAGVLAGGERLLATWASEVPITVYLAPGADLEAARRAAAALAPGARVEGVTGAEAMRRLRASLGDEGDVLAGLGDDVLPASVQVRAPGMSPQRARDLAGALRGVPGAADVDDAVAWLVRLDALLRRVRLVATAVLAAMALVTAVLVSNTLRLAIYARRDEIEIMKLVGATDAYVRAPFLVEGFIQGLAGAGLAVTLLLGATLALLPRLAATVPMAAHLSVRHVLPPVLVAGLLGSGAVLGVAASALSLRTFLRRAGR